MCSFLFFFFKQKTAYEMRISDWSSDVCSSDLEHHEHPREIPPPEDEDAQERLDCQHDARHAEEEPQADAGREPGHVGRLARVAAEQIGRASCRERVCQYV